MSSLPNSVKRWLGLEIPKAPPTARGGDSSLRRSNGLRELFAQLKGRQNLQVLDLGPASQANINFITGLGHKIYHEDLYPELGGYAYRVRVEGGGTRWDERAFLRRNLNYPGETFDAVFCWDTLDLLPEPNAAHGLVARLREITRPEAALLVFFHTSAPGAVVPVYRSQVLGHDSLQLFPRGQYVVKRPLNNRNIEKLFRDFHSLKFFLARDNLREVLAVR